MNRRDAVILGANHQFLYLDGIVNPDVHADTLESLIADERIDAVDCWVWAAEPYRSREIAALRSRGKAVNYNIGDRVNDPKAAYAACDKAEQGVAWDIFRRELDMALAAGARKIVMGSGIDFPDDRRAAKDRLAGFIARACKYIGPDVMLTLEPTDRDMDKRYLLGPLSETVAVVDAVRDTGASNIGILLDMGHIPLLRESIEDAVSQCEGYLEHVHLGNAIVSDPSHPLYGDKHVPWGVPLGEYGPAELERMLRALSGIGWLESKRKPTVSFEMRPYDGASPEESLGRFIDALDRAWGRGVDARL